MSFAANLARSKLTVALDLCHPLAFLALRPAIDLGRELDLQINWLPLRAQPLKAPSAPGPDDDRGTRHKRHRAQMIAREIPIYAQAQGRIVQEPYRDGPTDAAHMGWLWVRAQAPESLESFLEELFQRYWSVDLDAGDPNDVASVVDACGEDASGFRRWAADGGPAVVDAVARELTAAGVFQAPAFLVDDEVFYGRQHLPMVRWLLRGREGPVPI